MELVLAATWHPRGEIIRLKRLMHLLQSGYSDMVIVIPSAEYLDNADFSEISRLSREGEVLIHQAERWSEGRHLALQAALKIQASHYQYADLDRLLRWVEIRPEEWQDTCLEITKRDCLVIGRTPYAYQTHPQALIRTEAISNMVVSFFLGKNMDVSAGSKGFSRRAVKYLIDNAQRSKAMGADAEWVITLHQAGFEVDYLEVDGLDWESADRFQDRAASIEDQREAARLYDKNPANWAQRVEVAREIVEAALFAAEAGSAKGGRYQAHLDY